ncbi:MAG: hypothetical protein ABI895_41035 [Deltaproteobacteria bacterium]
MTRSSLPPAALRTARPYGRRWWVLVLAALALLLVGVSASIRPALGERAEGPRLARMQASRQWRSDQFTNVLARHDAPFIPTLWEFATGGSAQRVPEAALPVLARTRGRLRACAGERPAHHLARPLHALDRDRRSAAVGGSGLG